MFIISFLWYKVGTYYIMFISNKAQRVQILSEYRYVFAQKLQNSFFLIQLKSLIKALAKSELIKSEHVTLDDHIN